MTFGSGKIEFGGGPESAVSVTQRIADRQTTADPWNATRAIR